MEPVAVLRLAGILKKALLFAFAILGTSEADFARQSMGIQGFLSYFALSFFHFRAKMGEV
jgi:hypothetical protein